MPASSGFLKCGLRCGRFGWCVGGKREFAFGLPRALLKAVDQVIEGAFHNTVRGQVDGTDRINIRVFCPPVHANYHSIVSVETQMLPRPACLVNSSPARTRESSARLNASASE